MLVAFGEFLLQHGLLERLRQVPVAQKAHVFSPQDKLIELLIGIMSGVEHLQDVHRGPRPLTKDAAVAQAWGIERFAHFTTVGRTLAACDSETVAATEAAINAFSRPFVESAVHELLRRGQPVVYDLDLTGQPVSSTSTTYPDAAFGWMNDQVRLGYQLARASLLTHTGERMWLAGFHHPGDTVSASCLKELVQAAEAHTGVRPQRRPEWVSQRITTQQESIARTRRLAGQQQTKLKRLQDTHAILIGKSYHGEQLLKGPISPKKQARLQAQVTSWHKRLPRMVEQIAQSQQVLTTHQARLAEHETELGALRAWQAELSADNEANPNPPAIAVRIDAGFASGENLTWLLEMGYAPNTKAPNGRTTTALRAQLPRGAIWEKVGDNAEMVLVGERQLHGCPYPLTVALERFKIDHIFKYATLVRVGAAPALPDWFAQYNARQSIEAGNKEFKGTFFVQHLMSRSSAGIRLQVLFTGLAANIVRWAQPWLASCAADPTPTVRRTLNSPKALVRVAANATALVQQTQDGTTVLFGPRSALPGAAFTLRGVPAIQLPLGFQRPFKIASDSTIRAPNAHSLR
jgi:hypothetical protein